MKQKMNTDTFKDECVFNIVIQKNNPRYSLFVMLNNFAILNIIS